MMLVWSCLICSKFEFPLKYSQNINSLLPCNKNIFPVIAGNITSYSMDIFACFNSCYSADFSQLWLGNCPSFVFPSVAGTFPMFNWSTPGNCPNFLLWRRKDSLPNFKRRKWQHYGVPYSGQGFCFWSPRA